MKYNYLGDYIRQVEKRNSDGSIKLFQGISNNKYFITPRQIGENIYSAKIVEPGQFAYNKATTRNGEKISIAYRKGETCAVSSAYQVFEIIDTEKLLPEYLMLWFIRGEFDRYARFKSEGSAHEFFDWDKMCNVKIPIPDIEQQEINVKIYLNLLVNQKTYENSLSDLQLICDTFFDKLRKEKDAELLGPYIKSIETKNKDGMVKLFQGVSNNKHFITPVQIGENIYNAKIVEQGQFAYNKATTRNGEKISIAYRTGETCAVSAAYQVFEITEKEKLMPEFLMLWFTRKEFDRYARFKSEGSAHEFFNFDKMCNVKLPIPDIKVQEAIVTIYHTLETRKRINEQLKNTIKPLCPVLMRGVVENLNPKTQLA
jgi:type I restriction enzyme S subunit